MHCYSIHHFQSFSLKNVNNSPLAHALWPWVLGQFKAFLCPLAANPDVEFRVGPFTPELEDCHILDGKTYVRPDYLCTTTDYKFAKFKFDITGWESDSLKVRVSCNLPGFLVLSGLVIDPLLLYVLVRKQVLPVHAACIANERGAYLFAGSSGTGKTSICLHLMGDGYQLLGDNYTLLSNGRVYSFLSPLNIFSYNLLPTVRERVSRGALALLRVKDLLWRATGGYVKVFTKINPAQLWPEQTILTYESPKAVYLLVSNQSNRFRVSPISPQRLAVALVANMRLEVPEVLEWLAWYSFVNPEFAVHRWLERYELSLAEYLRQVPHLLRVEIPELHDRSIAGNIRALIRDSQD